MSVEGKIPTCFLSLPATLVVRQQDSIYKRKYYLLGLEINLTHHSSCSYHAG